MKKLEKRQILICLLASLLILGLTFYGLLPKNAFSPGKPFSLNSTGGVPPPNNGSALAILPLWQFNQTNIMATKSTTKLTPHRALTRNTRNILNTPSCQINTISIHKETQLSFVETPNTVLKFVNGQLYQYLDIPPPQFSL